jgi:3-phytase
MWPRLSVASLLILSATAAIAACGKGQEASTVGAPPPSVVATRLEAAVSSEQVPTDPDDPAIWLHPTNPAQSLVIGTNKVAAPDGALVVYGLDGRIRQTISGIDRPNNVDVEYGFRLGGDLIDIAVTTERLKHRLRVFRIDPAKGNLTGIGDIPVLAGQTGDAAEPMGIALYKRPSDSRVFAIVAPKTGARSEYLWQYALTDAGHRTVGGRLVRRFGTFSGIGPVPDEEGEIEAVAVDDELGYVYYADERFGIRKWHADPDHVDAGRELAVIGQSTYTGDREGLAMMTGPGGAGYLLSSDQIEGGTILRVYRRGGPAGRPHDHGDALFSVLTPADSTDGIEATSSPLPDFPNGMVVMMNSEPKNFLFFRWDELEKAGRGR